MYNSLRGMGITQIADAMLFAEQVFNFHASLRVVQADCIVFPSSDQQILRSVEVDGVYSPLVILSQPHHCCEWHGTIERAFDPSLHMQYLKHPPHAKSPQYVFRELHDS